MIEFKTEKLPDLARTLSNLPVDCQIASPTLPDKFPHQRYHGFRFGISD